MHKFSLISRQLFSGYKSKGIRLKLMFFFIALSAIATAQPNTWTALTAPSITPVSGAASFAIGDDFYVGLGSDGTSILQTLWKYSTINNNWTSLANYPGGAIGYVVAEVVNGKAYVGLGTPGNNNWYEYNPSNNIWTAKANFPGTETNACASFAVNNKIYVVGGRNGATYTNNNYQYDPATNVWTQMADITGPDRGYALSFAIDGFGYVLMGLDASASGAPLVTSYKYDPNSNIWLPIAAFPTTPRLGKQSFSICGKGYVYGGSSNGNGGTYHNDLYQYDPVANSWLQLANSPAAVRAGATIGVINNKLYTCFGSNTGGIINDFYTYTPPLCPSSSINVNAVSPLVTISPNPSKGILNIWSEEEYTLRIYNSIGQLILTNQINNGNTKLELSDRGLLNFVFEQKGKVRATRKQLILD